MIEIKNLCASIEGKAILKGFSLSVRPGEIHVIMGPNGAGKSTLARILAGDPQYQVTEGSVLFGGKELLELEVEERAHAGLFMGFQYPIEIAGLSNEDFLFHAMNSHRKAHKKLPLSQEEFAEKLREELRAMQMKEEFLTRDLNGGFSGGEKKRNEILQLSLLEPQLAILDETDSGLDIDAMKVVAEGVKRFMREDRALILITHYQRLLDYIRPDYVHVMVEGKIVESGGADLALRLEKQGYGAPC